MKKLIRAFWAAALMAGFAAAAADSPIAGTWQGKMGGVPAVTLTIKDDRGKLSGTVIFYKIVGQGSGPHAAGKSSAEMIDAKLEGKLFSFQSKGSQQMELTGKNEGTFKGKTTVTSSGEAPEIKMVRE